MTCASSRCRLATAAILAVGACVPLPKVEPEDQFTIDPHFEGSPAVGSGPPLFVSASRAGPGLDGPRMVYVKRQNELRYFARSRWVEPPARMLGPLLVRALERTGRFQAVTEVPAGSAQGLRLESEIVRLQQEFTERPSRVRFTVRLELSDVVAHRILGTREVETVEVAASEDAPGGVAAANAAVKRALMEAADWCAALSAQPGLTGGSRGPR
jgi:cholesterol transport system auxiliary component